MINLTLALVLCSPVLDNWELPDVPHLLWDQPAPTTSTPGRLLLGWPVGWRYDGEIDYTYGPLRLCSPDYVNGETIEVCYTPHPAEPALRFASPAANQSIEIVVRSLWRNLWTGELELSTEVGPVRFCWPEYIEWN